MIQQIRQAPDGTFFIPKPHAQTEAFMDKNYTRVGVELRWLKKPNIFQKAKSLAAALASGPASELTFEARLAHCMACAQGLKKVGEDLFCGLCGCGRHPFSRLRVKLKMKGAGCPLKKW